MSPFPAFTSYTNSLSEKSLGKVPITGALPTGEIREAVDASTLIANVLRDTYFYINVNVFSFLQ